MPRKAKKKVIKKVTIIKKRSAFTGVISFPLLVLSLVLLVSVGVMLIYRFHEVKRIAADERAMQTQLIMHNDHLWKRIPQSEERALDKAGVDNEVHFEFYNSLPNMQALSDQEQYTVSERVPKKNTSMVVNADELEKDFSSRLQSPNLLAKTNKIGKN